MYNGLDFRIGDLCLIRSSILLWVALKCQINRNYSVFQQKKKNPLLMERCPVARCFTFKLWEGVLFIDIQLIHLLSALLLLLLPSGDRCHLCGHVGFLLGYIVLLVCSRLQIPLSYSISYPSLCNFLSSETCWNLSSTLLWDHNLFLPGELIIYID